MSHEETIVRTAYSRLTYAIQLKTLLDSARSTPDDSARVATSVQSKELHITLSDFTIGNLADIAQVNYSDLVTKPNGDLALFIGTHTETVNEDGVSYRSELASTPRWIREQSLEEDWAQPMAKILPIVEKQNDNAQLTRYCAYVVNLEFGGRFRNYKSIFLFGSDAKGAEFILPGDNVININGGSLKFFAEHPVHPDVIVRSRIGNSRAVLDWIAVHKGGVQ
jgi:hypothetical protein